jgi:hypothetical protein
MSTIHTTLWDVALSGNSEELITEPDISTLLKNFEYVAKSGPAGQKGPTRLAALRVCGIDKVLLKNMTKLTYGWKCLICEYGSSSSTSCSDVKKHVWRMHQRGSSTESLTEARRATHLDCCGFYNN